MNNINQELILMIRTIADEKRIEVQTAIEALKDAISKSYMNEFADTNINIEIDLDQKKIDIYNSLTVVEDAFEENEEYDDYNQITLSRARKFEPDIQVGDLYKKPVYLSDLKRNVVSQIAQMFKNNISIAANKKVYSDWKERIGDIVQAEIESIDERSGMVVVSLENTYGYITRAEQIPGEQLILGNKYYFYIKDVKEQTKGWPIVLSRANAKIVEHFLKIYSPEIQEEKVQIHAIARVAGFKTKVVVKTEFPNIEPCGAVLGKNGSRIREISRLINNELIEVIEYNEDFKTYFANAFLPAPIVGYKKLPKENPNDKESYVVVCQPNKLALVIGKKGANIRLISILLNANIDVQTTADMEESKETFELIEIKSAKERKVDKAFDQFKSKQTSALFNKMDEWSSNEFDFVVPKKINQKIDFEEEVVEEPVQEQLPIEEKPSHKQEPKPTKVKKINKISTSQLLKNIDESIIFDDEEDNQENEEE